MRAGEPDYFPTRDVAGSPLWATIDACLEGALAQPHKSSTP